MLGGGVLLICCGILLGYREVLMLGTAAVVLVVTAVALVGRVRAVQVQRRLPTTRVQPGEDVLVRLTTTAEARRGRLPRRLTDRVHTMTGTRQVLLASGPTADLTTDYRLRAERRGVLDVGPVLAARSDPLGLAQSQRRCGDSQRVWIHPTWRALTAMPVGQVADPTGVLDGSRTGNLSFHGLRDYVPGDELRHIHWRSSARYDRLMVKEYVDTSHTRLTVLLDDRSGSPSEEAASGAETHPDAVSRMAGLDEAASAAASVVATAVQGTWSCELTLVSGASRDSSAGLTALLDLLSEAATVPSADLPRSLWRLRNRPNGDTVVLVSSAITVAEGHRFAQLVDRYPTLVLVCVGRAAEQPPRPPGVRVLAAPLASELVNSWNTTRWSM